MFIYEFDWNAFNYKYVGHLDNFPIIGCKPIQKEHDMFMITKRFETYVSFGNLGSSMGKVHCSPSVYIFYFHWKHIYYSVKVVLTKNN